jgi:CHAT domain-containing protein/Tfp pilus assembly protein PilF
MTRRIGTSSTSFRLLQNYVLCGLRLFNGSLVLICLISMALAQSDGSTAREKDGSIGPQQKDDWPVRLEKGNPIEREMSGGQIHTYEILLSARQFLYAVADQQGIDLVIVVFSPDGKQIFEIDSPNDTQGPEPVFLIAEEAGTYRLEVRSLDKGAPVGRYKAWIEEQREARPEDISRVAGEKAMAEAEQLQSEGSPLARRSSIEKYEEALILMRAIGNRQREADILNNIGLGYRTMGENQKALDYYNQAISIMRAVGDRAAEASTLTGIGVIYRTIGENQKALDYFNQALPITRALDHRAREATLLKNIGLVYRNVGENQKALDYYNQALPIDKAIGNRAGEAITLNNIGLVYSLIGENQKALDYYNQALPIMKAAGDRAAEANTLQNVGSIYSAMGEHQRALDYFNQALPITRAMGDQSGESVTLNNTGLVYYALGENQKALDYYNQALAISRALEHRAGEAAILINLGKVYYSLGENQKALDYFNQALPITKAIGDRIREAAALFGIGRVERASGDLSQAQLHIEASLAIFESLRLNVAGPGFRSSFLGMIEQHYEFYTDLLMHLHKLHPAEGHDRIAFKMAEMARARALLETLIEGRADIRKGVDPSLLERERSLQSSLNNKIERRIRLLSGKHSREQADEATKEVEALISDYEEVQSQIRAKSPQYAALSQPIPLSLEQVQRQVLDSETLLLEYSLGPDRSYLWAVTQSSMKSFELPKRAEIETAARSLYALLMERNRKVKFETADERGVRIASADDKSRKALAALSKVLLGPVSELLTKKRLLIVSDGALHYVPFAALNKPDKAAGPSTQQRPLILDHEIVYLPSASTLAILRRELAGRKPAPRGVAVLADPVFEKDDPRVSASSDRPQSVAPGWSSTSRTAQASTTENELVRSLKESAIADEVGRIQRLPFTRKEAKSIASFVSGNNSFEALDFDASRATAMSADMARYKYIHFATHAVFNSEHPELSGIVLSLVDKLGREQDGFLKAHDVYNLKLGADLAVLSSCRTALGKEVKGEGLVSLTRGFMYAGVARVLASLWNVSDEPTARLMADFYQGLLGKRGISPAAAIRAAQIKMLKGGRWQSPYYWAGFVLQGEPR